MPILAAILQALESAHAQGIIHRDVALDNIIVTDDGQIKLTDFGLARHAQTSEVTQTDGKLIGKVLYMSPEQVEGRPLDARTDLFSVAALDVRNGASLPAATRTSTVGMYDRTYAAIGPIIGLDCAEQDGHFPARVHDCAYFPMGLPQVGDPHRTHGAVKTKDGSRPVRPNIDAETASARRMHNRAYASAGKPAAKAAQTPPVHDRTYAGTGKPERPRAFEVTRPLPKERPPPAADPPLYVGVRVFGDPDGQATAALRPRDAQIRRCFLRGMPRLDSRTCRLGLCKVPARRAHHPEVCNLPVEADPRIEDGPQPTESACQKSS